jgi:hypothetical protein
MSSDNAETAIAQHPGDYARHAGAVAVRAHTDAERTAAAREVWRALWSSRLLVWIAGSGTVATLGFGPVRHAFNPPGVTRGFGWLGDVLAAPAARWDAAWYLVIAHYGYRPNLGAFTASRAAFFPLYPLGVRALSYLGLAPVIAGVVLSIVAFTLALYGLHRLSTLEVARLRRRRTRAELFGGEYGGGRLAQVDGGEVARLVVLLTAFAPMAFYFSAIYSESLYLALSVGLFLCARRGRWAIAAMLGALAAATRSTGVVLLVPLLLLYLYGPREDLDLELTVEDRCPELTAEDCRPEDRRLEQTAEDRDLENMPEHRQVVSAGDLRPEDRRLEQTAEDRDLENMPEHRQVVCAGDRSSTARPRPTFVALFDVLRPHYRLRRDVLWLALVPLGLGFYMAHLALAGGDPLAPFHAEDVWNRHFAGPYGGIWDGAKAAFAGLRQLLSFQRHHVYYTLAGGSPFVDGAHNLLLFAFLLLAIPAVIGVLRLLPAAYGVYTLGALALPLSYPVASQPLMSLPRFLLVLFPLNMWLAVSLASRSRIFTRAVLIVSCLAMMFFAGEFSTWHWVA